MGDAFIQNFKILQNSKFLVLISPEIWQGVLQKRTIKFGPLVYPKGALVIALVRPSVCQSVFKYLTDGSLSFYETLHEVRGQ